MSFVVTIIHVLVSLFLMLTVLLQAGKGGGMGATFGGGSSQGSVFGGSGAGNFLSKLTTVSAALFMLTSMTLAFLASTGGEDSLKKFSAQQRGHAKEKKRLDKEADALNKANQPDLPETEDVDPAIEGGESVEGEESGGESSLEGGDTAEGAMDDPPTEDATETATPPKEETPEAAPVIKKPKPAVKRPAPTKPKPAPKPAPEAAPEAEKPAPAPAAEPAPAPAAEPAPAPAPAAEPSPAGGAE